MATLKRAQIEEFFDAGYTLIPDVFSVDEICDMQAAFARLERMAMRLPKTQMYRGSRFVLSGANGNGAGNGHGVRIERIVWCGAAEPTLNKYGRDSRLLKMAALLLGSSEMNQLINQAHFKLPGDGVEFPWHQDSTHRRYGGQEWSDVNGRGSYVQTIIAVDEVTEDNGPLRVIPGSCRNGHLGLAPDGTLPPEIDEDAAISATMKPGSVLLLGPYTLHQSQPNNSTQSRRVFINGFSYPGANSRVYPGNGAGRLVHFR